METTQNNVQPGIQIVVTAEVKEGQSTAFEAQFDQAAGPSRKEEGNISYQLFKVLGKENNYVVIERYKSKEALDTHMAQPHTQALMAALGDLLTHPVPQGLLVTTEVSALAG